LRVIAVGRLEPGASQPDVPVQQILEDGCQSVRLNNGSLLPWSCMGTNSGASRKPLDLLPAKSFRVFLMRST
jgi:hypothetical protein